MLLKTLARAARVVGSVGGWRGGGEEGVGAVGVVWAQLEALFVGGGGEGGGGLGTHWKPLNTSKTLARAARWLGGWCGGGENGARAAK